MSTSVARAKNLRVTPRKARLVADLIRGKKVSEARNLLHFTRKASAPMIRKVLESAVANAENTAAENNERIDTEEMVVSTIRIDEAKTVYRYQARARGRAMPLRHRSSHIELVISAK